MKELDRFFILQKEQDRDICSNTHRFHTASLPSVPLVDDLDGFVFVRHVDCLGRSFFLRLFVNPSSSYTRSERESGRRCTHIEGTVFVVTVASVVGVAVIVV